jgi:hypothetical protein
LDGRVSFLSLTIGLTLPRTSFGISFSGEGRSHFPVRISYYSLVAIIHFFKEMCRLPIYSRRDN